MDRIAVLNQLASMSERGGQKPHIRVQLTSGGFQDGIFGNVEFYIGDRGFSGYLYLLEQPDGIAVDEIESITEL